MKYAESSLTATNVLPSTSVVLVTQKNELTDGDEFEMVMVSLSTSDAKTVIALTKATSNTSTTVGQLIDAKGTLANAIESLPLDYPKLTGTGTNHSTLDGVTLTEKKNATNHAKTVSQSTTAVVLTDPLLPMSLTQSSDDHMPPLHPHHAAKMFTFTIAPPKNAATKTELSLSKHLENVPLPAVSFYQKTNLTTSAQTCTLKNKCTWVLCSLFVLFSHKFTLV
jgi:hypothetical protein